MFLSHHMKTVKDLFVAKCSVQVHIVFSITQSDGHTGWPVHRENATVGRHPDRSHTAYSNTTSNNKQHKRQQNKARFPMIVEIQLPELANNSFPKG